MLLARGKSRLSDIRPTTEAAVLSRRALTDPRTPPPRGPPDAPTAPADGRGPSLDSVEMKAELHPDYVESHVTCTCGNQFTTRSTKPELHVEICSNCHPFYTGRQKLVDTGGRVERFRRRQARRSRG